MKMATWLGRNPQVRHILVVYLLSVFFCLGQFAYRLLRHNHTPLASLSRVYFRSPIQCNGWCVLHFALYVLLGFGAPSYWHVLIAIGMVFEVVEEVLSRVMPPRSIFAEQLSGRYSDILVNTVGVGVGVFARRLFSARGA